MLLCMHELKINTNTKIPPKKQQKQYRQRNISPSEKPHNPINLFKAN